MTTMPPISARTRQALRLHLPVTPPPPLAPPPAAVWRELLRLLAPLGEIWIETRLPGVGLSQRVTLHGVRSAGETARIVARGYDLRLFFDDWREVREIRPTMALAIRGRSGATLATLRSDAPICPLLLRSALRTLRDLGQPVRPAAEVDAGVRCADGATADDAQLRGRHRPTRQRLAETPGLREIPLDRLPAWLDAVLQQALPMRLQMGTAGVVQRCDALLRRHPRGRDAALELTGPCARLRLEPAHIDRVWVSDPADDGRRRQLRLYDSTGRALLFVEGVPRSDGSEDPRWRTLLNTLLD